MITERCPPPDDEGDASSTSSFTLADFEVERIQRLLASNLPESGRSRSKTHWKIVGSFETGGRRYILACEDETPTLAVLLTRRELQIVSRIARGSTNKQVAFELGISDTTVRVLVARAAARLGVRTRSELLEHPALLDLRRDATNDARDEDDRLP